MDKPDGPPPDAGRCKRCGSTDVRQMPGTGPHHARLVCAGCRRFVRWLPKPVPPLPPSSGSLYPLDAQDARQHAAGPDDSAPEPPNQEEER
jgi:hypothetical protein